MDHLLSYYTGNNDGETEDETSGQQGDLFIFQLEKDSFRVKGVFKRFMAEYDPLRTKTFYVAPVPEW